MTAKLLPTYLFFKAQSCRSHYYHNRKEDGSVSKWQLFTTLKCNVTMLLPPTSLVNKLYNFKDILLKIK